MAGYALSDLLSPLAVLDKISRIDLPGTTIQRLLGWNVANFSNPMIEAGNGDPAAVIDSYLRTSQYDIFDVTRKTATGSVPGSAANMIAPNKMGYVRFTLPRHAEQIPFTYEDLNNRRVLGGNASEIDRNGANYVNLQTEYLAQRFSNVVEFQAAAVCRGSYTFDQDGPLLRNRFTGGETTIDFQVPAGNKDQLDMLGAGDIIGASWATASTDIPLHLLNINKAFLQLTGQGLAHVICRGQTWNNVLNNTKVQAQAGTANVPWDELRRVEGSPGEFVARIRAIPWVTWHICDYGLELWDGSSETYETLLEDDHAIFLPDPNSRWIQYIRGHETVVEGPNGRQSEHYGFYTYSHPTDNPAGWNLFAGHNGMPALLRPKAMAYGDTTP